MRQLLGWELALFTPFRGNPPASVSSTSALTLDELRAWCDRQKGRRTQAAREIGVTTQAIKNWLAGRQEPTGEQALALLEFLKRHQR